MYVCVCSYSTILKSKKVLKNDLDKNKKMINFIFYIKSIFEEKNINLVDIYNIYVVR